jgi:hypothetical protein
MSIAEETAIVVQGDVDLTLAKDPQGVIADAKRSAQVLMNEVFSLVPPAVINGKRYPTVEIWTTVASFYGVTARIVGSNFVQFNRNGEEVCGFEAVAEAIHAASGQVISRAEAMCLTDEPRWKTRELHQLRAMAQTRSVSRVMRNVFNRVIVLAGLEATPAEEIDANAEEFNVTRTQPRPYSQQNNQSFQDSGFKKNPNKTITEKQVKLIFGRAKGSGHTAEFIEQLVQNEYGCKVTELTMGQMDELLERISQASN